MTELIGIPFDGNSSFLRGPAAAPQRIRMMEIEGSTNAFAENGVEIAESINFFDLGDMFFEETHSEAVFATIKTEIASFLETSNKVISIGGDHSITYPIIDAFSGKYANLNILHLDAHPDLYDDFDDNLYSHASPFARIMETRKARSLTQVGIRTFNDHQREQARKFKVNVVEMKDFNFDFLAKLEAPLYISLDLDVLDPAFAPGVSHHESGGMTTRQLLDIIQNIPVEIVGADIVEYNPFRDVHNMTAMVAYKLMKELIVKMM